MSSRFSRALIAALVALACVLAPLMFARAQPSSEPVEALTRETLLKELLRGGLILYFRHTATDFGQSDENMTSYEDCASQRNLTDKGRNEAKAIADAIKRLKIPLGKVLASPFCRTLETAQLAFGRAEKSMEVRGGPAQPADPNRYAPMRALLSAPVAEGNNLVIVSHGNPFRSIAGPPHLSEGEAAVIRPKGETFAIIGRIRVEDWAAF